jgi:hypothetical protein
MPIFLPNFGAEEGDVASSWATMSGSATKAVAGGPVPAVAGTFAGLARALRASCEGDRAFGDLDGHDFVVAWLNTPGAAAFATAHGRSLFGSDPAIVAAVHDKAFCVEVVRRHQLLPAAIDALIHIVDAEDVAVDVLLRLAQTGAPLQGVLHRGFTAKPRHGSSGRGRVDLRRAEAIAGAVARLRAQGGCIVEPWLLRVEDLAAAWRINDDGSLAFLGSSRAEVSGGGVWRGCTMVIDEHGVAQAPSRWRATLIAQATVVVEEAARRGLRGPCGVDAFVFVDSDGEHRLRVVELNARFTGGLLAVVLARGRPPGSGWAFVPAGAPELAPRDAVVVDAAVVATDDCSPGPARGAGGAEGSGVDVRRPGT